ncbi:MAG TPA: hypothetical protein VHN11_20815, partial [Xanthobacteraceae bacterium]|nr:hypothetical protein [Xanthobacteraceae bacterium]
MANTPKKLHDPTEAALSAIQSALNLREGEVTSSGGHAAAPSISDRSENGRDNRRRRQAAGAAIDEDLFFEETTSRNGEPAHDDAAGQHRAANDDRRSVGQILQMLQRQPSRRPYVAAIVASIAWTAVGIGFAISHFGAEARPFLGRGGSAPELFMIVAAIGAPVMFFFALAHLLQRAQELRIISRSMTDVALRLAEPETIARESIVSVGQAIRREVAAMGDGVERALARAAELEALVHNEVAALERAYNDNELRIRGLIEDLATQRDALVDQSEHVRKAISTVHLGLTQDITSVSEMVAASVSDAAQRITQTLAEKGEHITLALGRAGDSMIDALGERGGDLLDDLNRTGDAVSRTLEVASEKMTASLNVKTDHISEQVADLTVRLADLLSSRLDHVTEDLSDRTL